MIIARHWCQEIPLGRHTAVDEVKGEEVSFLLIKLTSFLWGCVNKQGCCCWESDIFVGFLHWMGQICIITIAIVLSRFEKATICFYIKSYLPWCDLLHFMYFAYSVNTKWHYFTSLNN